MPRTNRRTLNERIIAIIKAGKGDQLSFNSMEICSKLPDHRAYTIIFCLHEMVEQGTLQADIASGETTKYRLAPKKVVGKTAVRRKPGLAQ
jgi:hypothetical protein